MSVGTAEHAARRAAADRPMQSLRDLGRVLAALRGAGRGHFQLAVLLLCLGGVMEGLSIALLLPVMQTLVGSSGGALALDLGGREILGIALPDVSVPLAAILGVFVTLAILQVLFNRAKAVFLSDLLFKFTNDMRLELFSALSQARWDDLTRRSNSDLEHALTGEVERIANCAFYLLSLVQGLVLLAIYVVLSLAISPQMTLVMVAFGIIALVLMRPFRRRASSHGKTVQASRQAQYRTVTEFLSGLKSARASNGEIEYRGAFAGLLEAYKRNARDFARYNATGSGLFQIALAVGAAGFILLATGPFALDVSRIIVLLFVAMRIAPRFMGIQSQVQALLIDLPAWRHVRALADDLTAARDDTAGAEGRAVPPLREGIRLDGVTYAFAGTKTTALDGLTLEIAAGRVTALIGASGSGKSTIADLVTGLIRPQAGAVLFDGRTLAPEEMRGWRDRVAYVAQDSVLIDGSVRRNVTMQLRREVTDDEIWAALDGAAAAEFVRDLPGGLDARIGDRGVTLSGGQRQRIALARAFLRRPDFLLIDEATSALDWRAQGRIAETVKRMAAAGTTILTIAHRPSMVAFADMVYALEAGRVVEAGPREALLARPHGAFRLMVENEAAGRDA